MKNISLFAAILICSLQSFAQTSDHKTDGLGLYLSVGDSKGGDLRTSETKYKCNYPEFWTLRLGADYKYTFFKGLFVKPTVEFEYSKHNVAKDEWYFIYNDPSSGGIFLNDGNIRCNEFGFNVAALIGYTFYIKNVGLEVETGPMYNIGLYSKGKSVRYNITTPQDDEADTPYPNNYFYWRAGVNCAFHKFQFKISYDITSAKYYKNARMGDVLSFGVGYRF